jgi:hypothetical protein
VEWLQTIGLLITGALGGAALLDRWNHYRNRITGNITVSVLPGTYERPGENPWDPPIVEAGPTDGIIVEGTVHNNTSAPVVVDHWIVDGPPLESGPPHVFGEIIEAGKTSDVRTMFVPDWVAWDQRLESGLTSRLEPTVRVSLKALSRASSKLLTLRSARYSITDETVKANVVRAKRTSDT